MLTPGLFAALEPARTVLVAGAGGGFDVYAGLPLALALRGAGKTVHLANLSFTELWRLDRSAWVAPEVAEVTPETVGPDDYFPEYQLATWLAAHDQPATVFAFPQTGVAPLRAAYAYLVERFGIDAIVLVDGGTDILLRGDESALGTPAEDMTSLGAVAGLDGPPVRLVTALGFGIDAYHGVTAVEVLENLAEIDRDGGFLGAFSIPAGSPEAAAYRDAVACAAQATPMRPSIVNGQIAAALAGLHGDVKVAFRTDHTTQFVNPLMAMYFTVDLAVLARRHLYLDRLEDTVGIRQVVGRIHEFRTQVSTRLPRVYPH